MSEIDVSKCPYYGECGIVNNCILFEQCRVKELFDDFYKVEKLYMDSQNKLQQAIKDRDYYKQIVDGCKYENGNCSFCEIDKQLQQLKQENEFKESQINDWIKQYKLAHQKYMKLQTKNEKYKQCLDEIEEIAKNGVKDDCGMPLDELSIILQLIKQAKEGE